VIIFRFDVTLDSRIIFQVKRLKNLEGHLSVFLNAKFQRVEFCFRTSVIKQNINQRTSQTALDN